jgi:ubiquinone/menaquinone biosynthesis C-methylase UbiE
MTKLDRLRDVWESLARRDALWAILADESKAGGKWDLAEFMKTGYVEVETVFQHLSSLKRIPSYTGAALDFGCGVGRLTQALAPRFSSCVGVDISPEMIRKAEILNQYSHCRYVLNAAAHLPFANGSFSFVYTNIALQHVPLSLAEIYLKEFVRVLAPGGVLVFGIQDSFAVPDISSLLVRIRHFLRIRTRVKTILGLAPGDMEMHCISERTVRRALGSAAVVDIQITNTAARDYNGKLAYLSQPPRSGYVGKQYCVVK